jgi:cytochrome c peroxidase
MWRWVCPLVVVAGCWSDDPLVDGELTAGQLAQFRAAFQHAPLDACAEFPNQQTCDAAAQLGQELFFDVRLSDAGTGSGASYAPRPGTGKVSCASCHDPNGYFVDTRMPNNVSLGQTKWTKRNAMTVLDLHLKQTVAQQFTWDASYPTPGSVLALALAKAMTADQGNVTYWIRNTPQYLSLYQQAFPGRKEYDAGQLALQAYFYRLQGQSPFDAYVAGDDTALSDEAKRGFGVFVGRGTCVECHSTATLGDFKPRNTGIAQTLSGSDLGAGSADGDPQDDGAFATPSLRNIAMTAPYMHAGQLPTLDAVIEFYRRGGDPGGYPGTRDPRIQPLDLCDDDVRDLTAFLQALTDAPVDKKYRAALCAAGQNPGLVCSDGCKDVANDPSNCGACGHACTGACMGGTCL